MTLDEKTEALSEFTTESMETLLSSGVDVGMVQVGNETNNGLAGEKPEYNGSDLDLMDGQTTLHQLNGKVQVTMNVPFTLAENEAVKVFRVDGDSLVECKAAIENGKLVFTTDHFSTYAFVKVNTASVSKTKDVATGDNMNAAIFLMIAGIGIVCLYMARRKYTK